MAAVALSRCLGCDVAGETRNEGPKSCQFSEIGKLAGRSCRAW